MNRNVELMTSNQVLAEGWRLTKAILALKGMEIPDAVEFQIDGANHIRATRFATLDELAKAVLALDEAIERRSEGKTSVADLHGRFKIEERRDALAELQKRAGHDAAPASTTVIERFSPTFLFRRGRRARRRRLSAGWRSAGKRRLRSILRLLRSTGRTRKPWTPMA